ncbi:MAG: hypothetical protein JO122_12560 [Acetobacteraceae bacterium]|nr:hypothetical protein [Acetobacteraceae bacterium]
MLVADYSLRQRNEDNGARGHGLGLRAKDGPASDRQGTTLMRIGVASKRAAMAAGSISLVIQLSLALVEPAFAAGTGGGPPTLSGNTLSAVAWVPRAAGAPGGGGLSRFMLQAYLRPDGSALIRIWDAARNAYTPPSERNWSLSGNRLCLNLPVPRPDQICAEVHGWGPRIAGVGTAPYVMLDGDLKPGNALLGTR